MTSKTYYHPFLFAFTIISAIILGLLTANTLEASKATFCERHFIGSEYNPKLERQCRATWIKLTNEIKQSFNH